MTCHHPNPTGEREATLKPTSVSQLDIRQYSPPASRLAILPLVLLLGGVILPANVFAAPPNSPVTIFVNCPSSINAALASLDPSADNTIYVSGACSENVDIESFDRLQLIAQNGASITDASGGTSAVLFINNSTGVTVQGFTINGNPNAQNEMIDCNTSNCTFTRNTVQGGGNDGIDVNGAHTLFFNDTFQDLGNGPAQIVPAAGIFISESSEVFARGVIVQRVTGRGVVVRGFFTIRSTAVQHSAVQNNTGNGIVVFYNGAANIGNSTITGNGGDGIDVVSHSTLQLIGTSITGNHGVGILVKDLSFADLTQFGGNVVKNNLGSEEVLSSPKFPATRGALTSIGGGKTNSNESNEQ
jgi:hypothetical protein